MSRFFDRPMSDKGVVMKVPNLEGMLICEEAEVGAVGWPLRRGILPEQIAGDIGACVLGER